MGVVGHRLRASCAEHRKAGHCIMDACDGCLMSLAQAEKTQLQLLTCAVIQLRDFGQDCQREAAISLCKDRKDGQRVKHIEIVHHFASDHEPSGECLLRAVSLRTM
jgi:hypothetical protein